MQEHRNLRTDRLKVAGCHEFAVWPRDVTFLSLSQKKGLECLLPYLAGQEVPRECEKTWWCYQQEEVFVAWVMISLGVQYTNAPVLCSPFLVDLFLSVCPQEPGCSC